MYNELEKKQDAAVELSKKTSYPPVMPELDLSANTTKIPLSDLSTLGVAFQPLTAAIQTVVSGGGGSGLYYVNTKGMQNLFKLFLSPMSYLCFCNYLGPNWPEVVA